VNGAIALEAVSVGTTARMECNAIRECCCLIPDSAVLHPGYLLAVVPHLIYEEGDTPNGEKGFHKHS